MLRKLQKQTIQGWMMTEMLCYLLIVAAITIGAFYGFIGARNRYLAMQMSNLVAEIAANVQTTYMQYHNYEGLNTAKAIKMDILPPAVKVNPAQAIHHLQGGRIHIIAAPLENNDEIPRAFVIRFHNLSAEMCLALARDKWQYAKDAGLIAMEVKAYQNSDDLSLSENMYSDCEGIDADLFAAPNKGYMVACLHGERQTFPVNPTYAAKACNCTGKTCTITWKYM